MDTSTNLFTALNTVQGATAITIIALIILALALLIKVTKLPVMEMLHTLGRWLMTKISKMLNKQERLYHRDIEIGKINEKRAKVKLYRFLSDLIIDLNMTHSGITPYELLFITMFLVLIATMLISKIVFGSIFISIILCPIITVAVFCIMYTKANVSHDARIEAVIEAENIICNNIKIGVVAAIRESMDTLPKEVRQDFRDFIDNVEYKNYHVKTALQELNMRLGSIADDFIKKCIVFELEEEHGIANMFRDVVEVNNIKMQIRIEMKRKFEEVINNFKLGAGMIFTFLGLVLFIYEDIRTFYFTTFIGQLIICIDILLLIAEYVYITYLRAKEL